MATIHSATTPAKLLDTPRFSRQRQGRGKEKARAVARILGLKSYGILDKTTTDGRPISRRGAAVHHGSPGTRQGPRHPAGDQDKLFQPFLTTKPTGEGIGVGLSIRWDIVTQQHGSTIEVESRVGEFSEFTVRLPRSSVAAELEIAVS